jgi:fimbrial chaperone protein
MRRKLITALACASVLTWSVPASAGTLQVNPVLLEIGAGRRTATVTLRNEEAVPITIRAYVLDWRQADGQDVYTETNAMIVSPPIFTIPPGGTQLVRVGLRNASADPQAYRLIVEEVPEAAPSGGIRVALRLNLPLYASVPVGDAGELRWSAMRGPDGSWTIEAANTGRGYVRLNPDLAQAATGIRFADTVAFGTVLPGASRRWTVGPNPQLADPSMFARVAGAQSRESAAAGGN